MNHFHNTIHLESNLLKDRNGKCIKQEEIILLLFEKYPHLELTPFEVWSILGWEQSHPVTSVRRGMSNLTKAKKLIMTDTKVKERYGEINHKWRLRIEKGQRKLF